MDLTPPVTRRGSIAVACAAALLPWLPTTSHAQADAWPVRQVRIVVNFPPGSSPDVLARAVSVPLQQALGQPVVVDNHSGASGNIGADLVAKAVPDGYTLLMTAGSTITTNPYIFKTLPFNPAKDLTPVAALARLVLFLETKADLPVADIRSFLAYLKANPGKLSYGSAGNATGLHLAGEMLKSQTGTYAVHVPYRGAAPALQGLLAGQIDYYFDPGIGLTYLKSGRLKLLAVGALKRVAAYPDIPTLDEVGLKGFDVGQTHGIYAPAGTPPAIIERLNREINKALLLPAVRAQIDTISAEPTPVTPARFAAIMAEDSRRYGAIVKERQIKAD